MHSWKGGTGSPALAQSSDSPRADSQCNERARPNHSPCQRGKSAFQLRGGGGSHRALKNWTGGSIAPEQSSVTLIPGAEVAGVAGVKTDHNFFLIECQMMTCRHPHVALIPKVPLSLFLKFEVTSRLIPRRFRGVP